MHGATPPARRSGATPQPRVRRALTLAIILGLAAVGIGGFAASRDYTRRARLATAENLSALALGQSAQFADQIRERFADATLFAARDVVQGALSPSRAPAFRASERVRLLRAVRQTMVTYGYEDVAVLDTLVDIVAQSGVDSVSLAFIREHAGESMQLRRPVLIPVHHKGDGSPTYGVVVPVRDLSAQEEPVIGAIFLGLDARTWILPNLERQRRRGSTLAIGLVQRDGDSVRIIRADPDGDRMVYAETSLPSRDSSVTATIAMRIGRDTQYVTRDIFGHDVIAHAARVGGSDWMVIAKIDRDEAEAGIRATRLAATLIFVLIVAVTAAIGRAVLAERQRQFAQTEAQLAARAERVVETSLDGFVALDAAGAIKQVNAALGTMTGYTADELLVRNLGDLKILAPGESVPRTLERIRDGTGSHFVSRWRRKDGVAIDIDVSARYLAEEGGLVYAFVRDITEELRSRRRLERLNRVHTMLSQASEALQQARTAQDAYDALAQVTSVHGDFPLVWIGTVDPVAGQVTPVAAGGDRELLSRIAISLDESAATGRSATARCVRERHPVVYADFQTNPATAAFHDMARRTGVQAVAAFPILVDGAPRAALTLFSTDGEYFQPDVVALLGESTRFLASVLQSIAAAEEQRAEEERFRQLFEGSPLPMQVVDEGSQRVLRANRMYTETLGWRPEEVPTVAAALEKHFPEAALRERVGRMITDEMRQLSPQRQTVRSPTLPFRTRDGGERYMQVFTTRVGTEVIFAWVDLTELRQNRLLLDRAQAIARLVSWDYDFAADRMHFAVTETTGVSTPRDLPGLDWLFHEMSSEDEVRARVRFQTAARAGTKLDDTTKHTDADGTVRYRRSRIEFERGADGTPLRAVGSSQDVTDETMVTLELEQHRRNLEQLVEARTAALQRAYEQVAESDQRFTFAMEASSEGIWDWNVTEGKVTYSSVYQRLLGFEPGELPTDAKSWSALSHPEDRERVVRSLYALFEHHEARSIEFRLRRKDGSYLWVESTGKVVEREPDGTARRVVGTISDLTERRAAEDALRAAKESADEANRAKSSFLAVMSHEIRTPLNGVIGMAEVLTQSPLPAREAETVRIILNSAGSLLGLIDDILDFSKIEAGKLELDLVDTSLEEVVETVTAALGPVAKAKRVELSAFLAPPLPRQVVTDGTRLRQIIYNLVGNAIKFSGNREGRTGRVALRLEGTATEPPQLRVVVRDDGVGIPAAAQSRLFSSFMQAESSTTRRFGGTGLGLAICKRLTTLLGGEIAVESTEGVGTTFTVTIPMTASATQPEQELPDVRGLACVVVHGADDMGEADDITAYLTAAGAQVTAVRSDAEAEAVARTLTPPVILLAAAPPGDETSGTLPDDDHVRFVRVTHGQGRTARVVTPNFVLLDRYGLREHSLVRAVAVAAGRASPEIFQEEPEAFVAPGRAPLGIEEARAKGRLILVAEDDEVNQKVILRQLELLGYAAEVAADGAKALELWRTRSYALLLTDLHMPVMDGYQLTEAIRKAEAPGVRLPIAALTANAMRGEEVRARELGMDDYLTKPIRLRDLKASLERLIPGSVESSAEAPIEEGSSVADPSVPLDVTVLTHLVGENPEFIRQILGDFRERATVASEEVRRALEAVDYPRIAATMHRLKSAARSVGALPLGTDCARVESAAKRADADGVRQALALFTRELAVVDAELARALG